MPLRTWTPAADSTLSKLYMWAAAGGHENFCTEAFAAAIRADLRAEEAGPGGQTWERTLQSIVEPRGPSDFPSATRIVANGQLRGLETQVPLGAGYGTLDLRLDFTTGELWVEAKTGSPEGGIGASAVSATVSAGVAMTPGQVTQATRQLDAYQRKAAQDEARDGRRRSVVLLSPTRLGRDEVPWLPWQSVRAAALTTPAVHHEWLELVRFLEETKVLDDQLDAIRASEAASLPAAAGLYRKVAGVIWEVHERETRPRGFKPWTSKAILINALAPQLERAQMVAFFDTGLPAQIQWGVADQDGEAWWVIKIMDRKLGGPATIALRNLWDTSALAAAGWAWNNGSQYVMTKATRLVTRGEREEALAWFKSAFSELDQSGVVPFLLKKATNTPPGAGSTTQTLAVEGAAPETP